MNCLSIKGVKAFSTLIVIEHNHILKRLSCVNEALQFPSIFKFRLLLCKTDLL